MRTLAVALSVLVLSTLAPALEYADGPGIDAVLDRVAAAGTDRAEVFVIGTSREGRTIRGIRIGLEGDSPLRDRPRLLVVAGLAPDHRVGSTVAAHIAERILADASEDEALAALLGRTAVEVIPLVNPDGLAALLAGPARELRVTTRPVDGDRDGFTDEDGPDDLDGDGAITWMRLRDANGEWRVSDEDPRLMVRAGPGETGGWRLLTEGLDDDGDGRFNEDGPGGIDLDRNFAHGRDEHDPESGPVGPSEPESRALIDHVLANRSIACILVLGHRDNLGVVPEANRAGDREPPNGPLPDDRAWWDAVAAAFKETIGVAAGSDDRADGAFHQCAYYQLGIPAFAVRVFHRPDPEEPPPLPSGATPTTEDGRWLSWSDLAREGAGFLPWTPFEHPTLGPVEIGSFRPGFRVNPPAALLDDILGKHVRFVADLLGRLPRVAFHDVAARALSAGVYEVTATLVSEGEFPAITAMGHRTRSVRPIRVTIDRPRESILQGRALVLIDRLDRRGDRRRVRWVVRAKAGERIRIEADSEKAGIVRTEVTP